MAIYTLDVEGRRAKRPNHRLVIASFMYCENNVILAHSGQLAPNNDSIEEEIPSSRVANYTSSLFLLFCCCFFHIYFFLFFRDELLLFGEEQHVKHIIMISFLYLISTEKTRA